MRAVFSQKRTLFAVIADQQSTFFEVHKHERYQAPKDGRFDEAEQEVGEVLTIIDCKANCERKIELTYGKELKDKNIKHEPIENTKFDSENCSSNSKGSF